jgi:hypothetical protein
VTAVITVLVIVLVVALVAFGIVLLRRKSPKTSSRSAAEPIAPIVDSEPMTGLESALEAATDSSGTKISDRLDGETSHVDDLRVPDDTGPLLRRALDHVEGPDDDGERPPPEPAN